MARQLFKNNYDRYTGGPKRPVSKSMKKRFPIDMQKLASSDWVLSDLEDTMKARAKNGLSPHFIIYGKTTKTEGKD